MMAGDLFARFNAGHPPVTTEWRQLGYPSLTPRDWLTDSDAGLIWFAPTGPGLASQPIRTSPLVVAMTDSHPLSGRSELRVEDVLDETLPGIVDWCDPGWLGYWGLDGYRGGAPRPWSRIWRCWPARIIRRTDVYQAIRPKAPSAMDDQRSQIDIDIVERDDMVVVVVEGEVDLSAASEFAAGLALAAGSQAPAIVIDLDRVSFMDSTGVHVLLQFSVSEGNHDRLTVTRGTPQVQRLFEVTGIRRYLSFVPSPGL
jgi:anti-anti-sigma factor